MAQSYLNVVKDPFKLSGMARPNASYHHRERYAKAPDALGDFEQRPNH